MRIQIERPSFFALKPDRSLFLTSVELGLAGLGSRGALEGVDAALHEKGK